MSVLTRIGSEVEAYLKYEIKACSLQQLYFGGDDAIYDVIMQLPV